MNRIIAVLAGLFLAIHVSVGPVPAPVPVVLCFAAVIAGLLWLIFEAVFRNTPPHWAAGK